MVRVAAPLRMRVVSQLRRDISSFEFGPGARLMERDLCERYDVSRTVIREALRQLETEGLVTVLANHGPVVAQLSYTEAAELFEVRSVLEPTICKFFTLRAGAGEKQRLTDAVDAYEKSLIAGLPGDEWASPDDFYETLLQGCGNSFLANLFRAGQTRIRLVRRIALSAPGRPMQSLQELRDVADAINSGDLDAVWDRSETHVKNAASLVLSRLADDLAARAG